MNCLLLSFSWVETLMHFQGYLSLWIINLKFLSVDLISYICIFKIYKGTTNININRNIISQTMYIQFFFLFLSYIIKAISSLRDFSLASSSLNFTLAFANYAFIFSSTSLSLSQAYLSVYTNLVMCISDAFFCNDFVYSFIYYLDCYSFHWINSLVFYSSSLFYSISSFFLFSDTSLLKF